MNFNKDYENLGVSSITITDSYQMAMSSEKYRQEIKEQVVVKDLLDAICWASEHFLTLNFNTTFDKVAIVHIHTVEVSSKALGTARRSCLTNKDIYNQFIDAIEELRKRYKLPSASHYPHCGVATSLFTGLTSVISLAYSYNTKIWFEDYKPAHSGRNKQDYFCIYSQCQGRESQRNRQEGLFKAKSDPYNAHPHVPDVFYKTLSDLTSKVSDADIEASKKSKTSEKKNKKASEDSVTLNDHQKLILRQLSYWYSLSITFSEPSRIIETDLEVSEADFNALLEGEYIAFIKTDETGQRWGISKRGLKFLQELS